MSHSSVRSSRKETTRVSKTRQDNAKAQSSEDILRMRVLLQQAIAKLGQDALSGIPVRELMQMAATQLVTILEVEFSKILEIIPDSNRMILRAGIGWQPDVKLNETTISAGTRSQAGFTLLTNQPVIVEDLSVEQRFSGPELLRRHNVISGMSVILYGEGNKPYGVLGIHTNKKRKFTQDDIDYLQSVANILSLAIQRESIERRKDEFIGIASHELRTPLTSVKGYVQVLDRMVSDLNDERAKQYIKKTEIYIDRLHSLIADLLDVSKIQAGRLELSMSTFPLSELIQGSIDTIQPISGHHTIEVKGESGITVSGDKQRLEQVLTNLLSNAIKYSPNADQITISVTSQKNAVKIAVTDYGIGIPEQHQEKIFERFYRAEERSHQFSGLGIGLYISKEIISRHNGLLWVESTPGKGSTFFLSLPL